ncbi:MAG: HTH domain-containing protein [Nocardioides sp.]
MRASRLLLMMLLLQNRGRMTSEQLAEELEVSRRTILRDAEALGAAGLPIIVQPGRRGGIELGFNYRTRLTGLSVDEAEALGVILGRSTAELAPFGLASAGRRASTKLLESLPDAVRQHADRGCPVPAGARQPGRGPEGVGAGRGDPHTGRGPATVARRRRQARAPGGAGTPRRRVAAHRRARPRGPRARSRLGHAQHLPAHLRRLTLPASGPPSAVAHPSNNSLGWADRPHRSEACHADQDHALPPPPGRAQRHRALVALGRAPLGHPLRLLREVRVLRHPQRGGVLRRLAAVQFWIRGKDAERLLAGVLARRPEPEARPGAVHRLVRRRGFVLEDGVLFRHSADEFLLTAAEPNLSHLRERARGKQVEIVEVSEEYAVLALQGPRSRAVLEPLAPEVAALSYFSSPRPRWPATRSRSAAPASPATSATS